MIVEVRTRAKIAKDQGRNVLTVLFVKFNWNSAVILNGNCASFSVDLNTNGVKVFTFRTFGVIDRVGNYLIKDLDQAWVPRDLFTNHHVFGNFDRVAVSNWTAADHPSFCSVGRNVPDVATGTE